MTCPSVAADLAEQAHARDQEPVPSMEELGRRILHEELLLDAVLASPIWQATHKSRHLRMWEWRESGRMLGRWLVH